MTPQPPLLARLLLRLRRLGEEREDVEADLYDLFKRRTADRGAAFARRRFLHDVVSLWLSRPQPDERRVTPPRGSSGFGQDLMYALRLSRRQPGAVSAAVLGLAVGIGVCGSVFSVLNALALRPFGIADPSSAVRIYRTQENGISTSVPFSHYAGLREHAKLVTLEAWLAERLQLETAAQGSQVGVGVAFVSGGYFATLGGTAARGRVLESSDDVPSATAVAVMSHGFWARRFNSDDAIVGQRVWLNGVPVTIVGVGSADFTGPSEQPPALWMALGAYSTAFPAQSSFSATSTSSVGVLGRLAPSAVMSQAEAELNVIWRGLPDNGIANGYTGVRVVDIDQRFGGANRGDTGPLIALTLTLGVVLLVLMLACGNVANLLLASASARQHEFGVRFALGASRWRVFQQLLTESLLLAAASGVLGGILTLWMVPLLGTYIGLPPTIDPRPDVRVYAFVTAICALAGVIVGLAPARVGTRANVIGVIRGDAASDGRALWSTRFRSVLVGAQAAGSLIVLVLALVMARAAIRTATIDTGFEASKLLTMAPVAATAESGLERLGYDEARVRAFWTDIQARVAALPDVESVALAMVPPFSGVSMASTTRHEGRRRFVYFNYTSANYFDTLGLRTLRGRIYTDDDARAGAAVAVISETAAREYWGDEDPIGSRLDRLPDVEPNEFVIGVVSDAMVAHLSQDQTAAVYRPLSLMGSARLVVRAAEPSQHVRALHDIVRNIDPALRPEVALVANGLAEQRRIPATIATIAGTVAAIAIGLSAIGLAGITAFSVRRRQSEVAVRVAMGASAGNVIGLFLRDCLRPVLFGLTAGTILAVLAGRIIAGSFFGVSATDPASYVAALLILLCVTSIAVVVPTRRAARTDAAAVLRRT